MNFPACDTGLFPAYAVWPTPQYHREVLLHDRDSRLGAGSATSHEFARHFCLTGQGHLPAALSHTTQDAYLENVPHRFLDEGRKIPRPIKVGPGQTLVLNDARSTRSHALKLSKLARDSEGKRSSVPPLSG